MLDLRRRQFITLLGGAVAAWPLAVRAQQPTGVHRIAFLHPYAENDPEVLPRIVAFRQGLEALGWVENRNIRVEHRYSGGDLAGYGNPDALIGLERQLIKWGDDRDAH
jgi:putative ABC transport system substrate-binding protein